MKITKIIVVLLILLGVSTYALDSRVRGYETDDCTGSYLEAGSFSELKEWHNQTDSFGNTWHFESYIYVEDADKCHDFNMPHVIVKGTRLPDDSWDVDDTNGDAGRGGSTNTFDGPVIYKDNPGKDFDATESQELVECLDTATADMEWKGDYTNATWIADAENRKDKWSVTDDDSWEYDKFGFAEYGDNNVKNFEINVAMHGINMGDIAKAEGISFRHMLIYWHLHELVHVMQAEHERNDGDNQYKPSEHYYDKFLRELEAIEGVDEIWRKLFGEDFDPPFLRPEYLFDYDEKRNRVKELLEKQAAGTLSEDEKKELKNLQLELYELHHGELPKAEVNKYYKNKKLEHCVGKAKKAK